MLFALFKEKKLHKVVEHKGGRAGSPICYAQNYMELTP